MSEGTPEKKKDKEFGTGAFKKAIENAKRSPEKQEGKGQGARRKESSRGNQLEEILTKIFAEEKLTGAKILNYLNDAGGRSASPEAIKQIMEVASQRLDKGTFKRLEKMIWPEHLGQPEAPKSAPALEHKPASDEKLLGEVENAKAPPVPEDISPEDFERKLRQSAADWQGERAKGEEESSESSSQEPAVESQAVSTTVEAEPAAQTVEAAPGAPEEQLDAAQRVARDLAVGIPEGTPQELKKLLHSLVEKVEAAGTKGSERMKTLKEHLANRLNELNGEAREEGIVGQSFRSLGETYDKLDLKSKIAIGLTLGLGAGVLSTVSLPGVLACMSGIAVQRIAGLSSAFLKYEKNAQDEKWGKEKAMAKAIGHAAFMTGGMLLLVGEVKEGIAYLKEQHAAEATLEWLKQYWPFGHAEEASSLGEPLVTQEEAEAHMRGVLAAEEKMAAKMPSIEASAGHGYEYMVKRLWEGLQAAHLDPNRYAKGSDIRQLLEADAQTIDSVVHKIAADPGHGFFRENGESVRIDPGMRATIGADGQVHLLGALGGETVQAGAEAAVTPPYHPDAAASAERPSVSTLYEETDTHIAKAEEHLKNIQKLAAEQQAALGGSEDASPDASLPIEGSGAGKVQNNFNSIAEKAFKSGHLFTITADTPLHDQAAEAVSFVGNDHSEVVKFKSLDASGNIVDKLAYWDGENVAIEAYWDEKNVAIEAPFGRDANGHPFSSEQEAKDFEDLKRAVHDPRETGEWPGGPAKEQPGFFENLFGTGSPEAAAPDTFEIPATEAHVYATGSNELFVYGGSWEKQGPLIQSYLEAHPKEIVYSADAAGKHRIPWSLVDGRLTPGTPVRTGGFLGFGSSWAEAPDPKEFIKIIK